jgi:hypothetical protein
MRPRYRAQPLGRGGWLGHIKHVLHVVDIDSLEPSVCLDGGEDRRCSLLLAMHVNGDDAVTFTGKEVRQSTFSGLEPAGPFVHDARSCALKLACGQWLSPLR